VQLDNCIWLGVASCRLSATAATPIAIAAARATRGAATTTPFQVAKFAGDDN